MVMILVNKNLVGRCGIYCGSCIIFRAYKDSEKLRQKIAERENCKPKDIRCEGCQTVLVDGWESEEWGKNCQIVKCLEAKGLNFCYECTIYPNCEKFRALAKHSLTYGEDLAENLNKIRTNKVEEWLEEEAEKWKCQKCRKSISRHLTDCHWCGTKLREQLQHET